MNVDTEREALCTAAHFLTSEVFKDASQFSIECTSARMLD